KPDNFIIPAVNFKNTVIVPAVKLSSEEQKLITNEEYAVGDSAPKAEDLVPDLQNKIVREKEPKEGLPDPEKSPCDANLEEDETDTETQTENTPAKDSPVTSNEPSPTDLTQEKVSGLSIKS